MRRIETKVEMVTIEPEIVMGDIWLNGKILSIKNTRSGMDFYFYVISIGS